MSINQLINLATKHNDSYTLVVLSEMNTFAYQYNPVPKPLNKNVTASAMSNMIGQIKVQIPSQHNMHNSSNSNLSKSSPSSSTRMIRSNSINEPSSTMPRTESFGGTPSKFMAGAKKAAESAKAKKLAEEAAAAKEKESKRIQDSGSNKHMVIDKDLNKAIIYPCLLDVADSEGMLSLMSLIIKSAEVTINENPSEGHPAFKIAYNL
jgi:hypothetical protein